MKDVVERLLEMSIARGKHPDDKTTWSEAAVELAELRAEVAAINDAMEPVRHWYDGDGEITKPDLESVLRDFVADLQTDRADVKTCPDAGAYSQAKNARLELLVELFEAVDLVIAYVHNPYTAPEIQSQAIARLRLARERFA